MLVPLIICQIHIQCLAVGFQRAQRSYADFPWAWTLGGFLKRDGDIEVIGDESECGMVYGRFLSME